VVSFTPCPFCLQGESPQYPLCRRLSGSQNWYVHCGVKRNLFPLLGIESHLYKCKNIFTEFNILIFNLCVFNKFPKYLMKILLVDYNGKVGREDIFKTTVGNESSHEIEVG
jgi:hypothetical protein